MSGRYLFPVKIKRCIHMFGLLSGNEVVIMRFFGGENQTDADTAIVSKTLVTFATLLYIFRFEQICSFTKQGL